MQMEGGTAAMAAVVFVYQLHVQCFDIDLPCQDVLVVLFLQTVSSLLQSRCSLVVVALNTLCHPL
jgi:hypothetical protein